MKKLLFALLGLFLLLATGSQGQVHPDTSSVKPVKRFYWGGTFHTYWSSIHWVQSEGGAQKPDYFYKPSLGGGLQVEYYLTPFLGIRTGIGYQQRGAGIKVSDNPYHLTEPAQETYRTRLRFHGIDLPLSLVLRSPQPLNNGIVRLSASAGLYGQLLFKATKIRHSVEDGFHDIQDLTGSYRTSDVGITASLGADIDAIGCMLQVHAVTSWGSTNVYHNEQLYPGFNGRNRTYGIRLGFMF